MGETLLPESRQTLHSEVAHVKGGTGASLGHQKEINHEQKRKGDASVGTCGTEGETGRVTSAQ